MTFKLGNREWTSKEEYLAERDKFLGARAKQLRSSWAGLLYKCATVDIGSEAMDEWLIKIGAWTKADLECIRKWEQDIQDPFSNLPQDVKEKLKKRTLDELAECVIVGDALLSRLPEDVREKVGMRTLDEEALAVISDSIKPWPPDTFTRLVIFLKKPCRITFSHLVEPNIV